ncbi:MAG: chorismate-binding protein [Maribacter sp.]|nr:chorismate-binding protein [Maribacter sp.]
MFSELMKTVEVQLSKELPFVIYSKPNSKEIHAILQKDNQLHHISDFTEKGFVFAPFDAFGPVILIPLDEQHKVEFTDTTKPEFEVATAPEENIEERKYHLNLVKKGLQQIEKGEIDKVVLSRKLEIDCSESPLNIFRRLISIYKSAFCYLWYHPEIGMWLGATPEILLRTESNRLTTMSLAGTQPYVKHEYPEWGQKEFLEQFMVTDYIANVLKGQVVNLQVSEIESVRAGNLWHLRTKLTGVLKKNLKKVIKALHPTPAICGIPSPSARKFIYEHENYNREYYTGYLGELNFKQEINRTSNRRNQENKSYRAIKTKTELFVNLRCMQLVDGKAFVYVGGGITKDSIPENEWQETIVKSMTILGILNKG